MKNIKYLTLILSFAFVLHSCNQDIEENEAIFVESVGGLLNVATPAIGYVVGDDGTYTASGTVYQGRVSVPSIDVLVSFTAQATGSVSNEVLLTTLAPAQESFETVPWEFSFKYEDLIAGLTIDGAPLPASDAALNIGDFFTLKYLSSLSTGGPAQNNVSTKVAVNTRFAGTYTVSDPLYFRIGVQSTFGWPETFIIESIDATTYLMPGYFGPFDITFDPANELYFQIDENDIITYPPEKPNGDVQLGNGEPLITCQTNPADFSPVPCDPDSNFVQRDDINGADILYMTYGYFTGGSGPRVFYSVLTKDVD